MCFLIEHTALVSRLGVEFCIDLLFVKWCHSETEMTLQQSRNIDIYSSFLNIARQLM